MTFLLREIQLLLGVAAALAFLTGWLVARFRASDQVRRSEALVREMSEIKEGLEHELQEHSVALQGMTDTQVTRELAVQEVALEEMRESVSDANQRAEETQRRLTAAREEIHRLQEERDQLLREQEDLQADRRATQDQLAASRRAHEDLTERYVTLEGRMRRVQASVTERPSAPPAPESPSVETITAAAAEAVVDLDASTGPATSVQEVAGRREGARLEAMGLHTHLDLVRKCGPRAGREIVSASTGIPQDELRRWTGLADLLRLTGMDRKAAALLHEAGIGSIQDLASADARDLQSRLAPVIDAERLRGWMQSARNLQPMVEA